MRTFSLFTFLQFCIYSYGLAQKGPFIFNLDKLVIDTTKGTITDTLLIDLNADGIKDLLLEYVYEYNQKESETISSILMLYIGNGGKNYYYKNKNTNLVGVIEYNIHSVNNKTFVIEQHSRRNYNKFFCYIQYDPVLKNWFLIKDEVIKDVGKIRVDSKTKNVIETGREKTVLRKTVYTDKNKIPFEEVNFWNLFKEYNE
jgi:hypothetical protein